MVLVHPSTVSDSNVGSRTSAASFRSSAEGTGASVVTNASMVARWRSGAIMPTPFAHPPTRYGPRSARACLGFVSVVMMASAKLSPPSGESEPARPGSAASSWSMWSGSPMTPVEQASIASGSRPSSSAAAAVERSASLSPDSPVPAFAWPLLTSTARAPPRATRCRDRRTGAAAKAFVVNRPAAERPSSATNRPRSGRPEGFIPAVTPAARNPRANVTLMGTSPWP